MFGDGLRQEAAGFVWPGSFVFKGLAVKTYRVDYLCHGEWVPGNLVRLAPAHLNRFLEFLDGDRPLVSFITVNGHSTFKKVVERKKGKCLPTRVRAVEPDWGQEDGYYLFDGVNMAYVSLMESDGFRSPRQA